VHDSIELERRGIPSIAICTTPFESGARAMSRLGGISDYPFAIIQHPVGSLDEAGMRERAIEAAPQVISSLLART
jgi:hypothetical protein